MEGGRSPDDTPVVDVESLDLEGRGVAHLPGADDGAAGKVVFVEGALPGERVRIASHRRKSSYEIARVVDILRPGSTRVAPRCPHFGVCGGCSMQHLDPAAQVAVKQRVLEDTLWHIARLRAETILRPIQGPAWGYRYRARLSVRYVPKKGGVLVGFHERGSSYVADMRSCEVLPAHVSALLVPLRALITELSIRDRLPQIEYAQGADVTVLVLRTLEPWSESDAARVQAFADTHGVQIWLQPKGPDSAHVFHPANAPALTYALPEFGITMPFRPTDFTQVNHRINRVLVAHAIGLLAPQAGERILDLFCGLGNFTLPLARCAVAVHGIEGDAALVRRAEENAQANAIVNASFAMRNLFEISAGDCAAWAGFDRILVDPPREGALAVVRGLVGSALRPKRLVYVSCNPATLARDAAVLVHQGGWTLKSAGVINMFPHTSHVESVAVFEPGATVQGIAPATNTPP